MNSKDIDVLSRYKQKIQDFCGGVDPYALRFEKSSLPTTVGYFDVVNYCIEKDSAYTRESFKAYKSLKAYEYYESGWVQEIQCKEIASGHVVVAKVCLACRNYNFNQRFVSQIGQAFLPFEFETIGLLDSNW